MTEYPLTKFHFQVQCGNAKMSFTEVTGLDHQIEVIEYRAGDFLVPWKIKQPGLHKFSNITMKKGSFRGDNELFKWLNTVQFNIVDRRDLIISLLNESHEPVITWKINRAWPVKVQDTDLKADGNEVAIETVEIAHEGLEVQNDQ